MIEITSSETFYEYHQYFRIYNMNLYRIAQLLVSNLSSLSNDEINKYKSTDEFIFVPFNIDSIKNNINYDNMNKYLEKEYTNDIKQSLIKIDYEFINNYIRIFKHDIEYIINNLMYIDHPSEELFNIITYKNVEYSSDAEYDEIDYINNEYDEYNDIESDQFEHRYEFLSDIHYVLESIYDDYYDYNKYGKHQKLMKNTRIITIENIRHKLDQIIDYNNWNKSIDDINEK